MPTGPRVAAFAIVAALAASGAPLLVYTLSLALFGLPHVLAELRYVDDRFAMRFDRRIAIGLVALLTLAVLGRLLVVTGLVPGGTIGGRAELLILAALGALVVPSLIRSSGARGALAAGICLVVGLAAILAPIATLILLAVLHNLTPIAFLAERLRGEQRRRAMIWCAILFLGVPALIATGLPFEALAAFGLAAPEASLLAVGSLSAHLGVFVPAGWTESPFAVHLFTAAVYLQVLHYGAVLHVLPGLTTERVAGRWPRGRFAVAAVSALGAIFFCGFALSFGDARSAYGLFALVHAWIELPLLLGALGGAAAPTPVTRPA